MANISPWRGGAIGATQFAAAIAIVLWPAGGWAQKQSSVQAAFTPVIQQELDARTSSAKVTSEDELALESKGYVKIGTVRASYPGNKSGEKAVGELEAAILRKAAEAGGDFVRFSAEGRLEEADVPTGKTKAKAKCELTQTTNKVVSQDCAQSCIVNSVGIRECVNSNCTPVYGTVEQCLRWGPMEKVPITKKEKILVSEGTVWRAGGRPLVAHE